MRHMSGAAQQRDAAYEGRFEQSGSIVVSTAIVNEGKVVRPSQELIASVLRTVGEWLRSGEERDDEHEAR